MLVLQRKAGQSIVIGDQVVIHVSRVSGNSVKVGIEAPQDLVVRRSELPPNSGKQSTPQIAQHKNDSEDSSVSEI